MKNMLKFIQAAYLAQTNILQDSTVTLWVVSFLLDVLLCIETDAAILWLRVAPLMEYD